MRVLGGGYRVLGKHYHVNGQTSTYIEQINDAQDDPYSGGFMIGYCSSSPTTAWPDAGAGPHPSGTRSSKENDEREISPASRVSFMIHLVCVVHTRLLGDK